VGMQQRESYEIVELLIESTVTSADFLVWDHAD
jgi:hypothetical protein